MSTLAFVGKPRATENEKSALDFLGRALAADQHQLVITPRGDSNIAVCNGYLAKGGNPTQLASGVLEAQYDHALIYADEALKLQLDDRVPGWGTRPHLLLDSDEALFKFLDNVLIQLNEKGITVNPYD